MAKKLGKGAKGHEQAQTPQQDPRYMFGAPPPLPRQAGVPASSTPLTDYLARGWPGVDDGYVVLPRSLAESMSLPWQQQMVNLLAQFHQGHSQLAWPAYRVVPSRYERLVDLDEEQLDEAGYLVEIDSDGELVYRERSGRQVENAADTVVLVPCLDPIATQTGPQAQQQAAPEQAPAGPAPMNIGPQPVWPTPPHAHADEQPAGEGEHRDFGPTGEPTEIPYRYRR